MPQLRKGWTHNPHAWTQEYISYRTAAAWWGLLPTSQARVDVTSPHGRHAINGARRHQARSLLLRDKTTHEGMPITSVARTLLDLAATSPPPSTPTGANTRSRRPSACSSMTAGRHRQVKRAPRESGAQTRATAQEPKLTRSELEAIFLERVRHAGLHEPETNVPLTALDHRRLDPDFYWPAYRLVVETDGWGSHRTRAAFESDRRRDADLLVAGLRVLRFTWRQIRREPARVEATLRAVCG
jgi:very-short-patch-repair endonuclease